MRISFDIKYRPFDIKYRPQIESGEYKVVTRDRKPVRIICWDRFTTEHSDNIVALVTGTKSESTYYYYQDGHLWNKANGEGDSSLDLFIIIPELELTELERVIKRGMLCAGLQGVSTTIIKETAKEVRDIVCRGCTVGLDQYWKGREDARKEAEKSYTFHYPTYEPPCHHGGICTNPFKDCINCPRQSNGATISTTSGTCKKD